MSERFSFVMPMSGNNHIYLIRNELYSESHMCYVIPRSGIQHYHYTDYYKNKSIPPVAVCSPAHIPSNQMKEREREEKKDNGKYWKDWHDYKNVFPPLILQSVCVCIWQYNLEVPEV